MTRAMDSLKDSRGVVAAIGMVGALLLVASPTLAQRVVPLSSDEVSDMALDPAAAPAAESMALALNKAKLITLAVPIRDVIIANPNITDVIVKTPRQVYLVGQGTGETSVFFVGLDNNVVKHLVVEVEANLDEARQALRELLPDADIKLRNVNSNVVMSGVVRSAQEVADALRIVSRYVEYDDDEGEERVINMLRITQDQQVMLKVRVGEIQRSTTKALGFNSSFNRVFDGGDNGLSFDVLGAAGVANPIAAGTAVINDFGFGSSVFATLERQGLLKTLAEPVLTAISGETASFLAGGEFPTPSSVDTNGQLSFEFRPFGVVLAFAPIVISGNQISLDIGIEVSEVTTENSITVGGTTIPGLNVRRTESTVTVPSGGSLMISGLLQNNELNSVDGLPGLMNLPVLGALFRSQSFQRDETEPIVIVSAYTVRNIDSPVALSMPTDGFVTASETDMYLYGRLHKRYSSKGNLRDLPSVFGPFGYIMK